MIATTQTVQPYVWFPGSPPASFAIPFAYQQTSEIFATLSGTGMNNVQLVQGVDFTVTPPSPYGGTLTRLGNWSAYSAYTHILVFRSTAKVNEESMVNGGGTDANRLEFMIDELTQMIQEIGNGDAPVTGNVLRFPISDPVGLNVTLPNVSVRAMQALTFDANGNAVVTAPSAAPINAAWQAALAQSDPALLYGGIGQSISENRKTLGELFFLADYKAPAQWSPLNPELHFPAVYLGAGDQVIDVANWPLLQPNLYMVKLAYLRGTVTEQNTFNVTAWAVAGGNTGTLTFAATTPENAMITGLLEEWFVQGGYSRTITLALPIGNIPGGTYPITNISGGARQISFTVNATNGSGSATATAEFYTHRIAGSTTTAKVFDASGRVLMQGNAGVEVLVGLRMRDRIQGFSIKLDGVSGSGINAGGLAGTGAAGYLRASSGAGAGDTMKVYLVTDGANGTPHTGAFTNPRLLGAALFMWGGRFLP